MFQLHPPVVEDGRVRFSSDLVRLRMNPVAGHVPKRLKLRWLHTLDFECGFVASTQVSGRNVTFQIRDDHGKDLATGEVVMQEG